MLAILCTILYRSRPVPVFLYRSCPSVCDSDPRSGSTKQNVSVHEGLRLRWTGDPALERLQHLLRTGFGVGERYVGIVDDRAKSLQLRVADQHLVPIRLDPSVRQKYLGVRISIERHLLHHAVVRRSPRHDRGQVTEQVVRGM